MTVPPPDAAALVFPGDSEMAARCRAFDWAATPLGAVDAWPQSLRTTTATVLATGFASIVLWGPDLVQLYNDAYIPFLGAKHPGGLGRPTRECWPEVWAFNAPIYGRVQAGETVTLRDQLYPLRRRGPDAPPDDVYITLSYAPVRDEAGAVGGMFLTLVDTTAEVTARRLEAERVRLAAALEVERARLAAVFHQSPAFFAVLRGPDNVFEFVNPAYEQIIGRGRQVVGRPLFDALPEARGQGFDDYIGRVRATGEPLALRELPALLDRTPGAPREERFIDITYLPLVEADGSHEAVVAHGTDVTEQVRARREIERLLAASEAARVELAAANAQLQDQQVELELASQQAQETAAELETQAEELHDTAAELEERTMAAERARAESEAARADADRARRETARVLAATDDGLLGTDLQGRTTFANPAAERLLGYTAAEMIGRPQHALIHHTRADGTPYPARECPLYDARRSGTATRVEGEVFWRKDGTAVPVEYAMTPIVEDGAVVGTVVTFRDVSERRAADTERARLLAAEQTARHEAESANRAKAEFLATMSHELRTPLNAIGGYAELLELGIRGPVTEAQRADLARIQQSQRHLLGLVNEVLDLAKVDAGEVRVDRAPVPVAPTVDAALALVRPQAAAKALALDESCLGTADAAYVGDEPRVRQILVNLLANAVKFTPRGGRISVTCALYGALPPGARPAGAAFSDPLGDALGDAFGGSFGGSPSGPYVALRVEDTGVGIAAGDRERVFQPFTQAGDGSNPYTRPVGGTGLGLTISRRFARLMGGDITLESTPGEGSAFTLWLPAPERRSRPRAAPADDGAGTAGATPEVVGVREGRDREVWGGQVAFTAPDREALARVGDALVTDVREVIRDWVARLRADPGIPDRAARSDAELEDHAATFVTDVGLALRTLADPTDEPGLLRDGTAILGVIAERHGAQRARLGWPAEAVGREFLLLGEVLDAAARRTVDPEGEAAERARAVVTHLVAHAERVALGGLRVAGAAVAP